MTTPRGLTLVDPPISGQDIAGQHITNHQMSELIASRTSLGPITPGLAEDAEAHLRTCPACAAELASLRDALSLFQEATVAHADREFVSFRTQENPARRIYPVLPTHRSYSQTLILLAASLLLMAVAVPLEMRWQRHLPNPATTTATPATAPTVESDEALLEDVNQDLTRTVPASMQSLDDPTGIAITTATTSVQTDTPTSIKGKD